MYKMSECYRASEIDTPEELLENINHAMTKAYKISKDKDIICKYLEILIDDRHVLKFLDEVKLPTVIDDMLYIEKFVDTKDKVEKLVAYYRCVQCGSMLVLCTHDSRNTGKYHFYGCPNVAYETDNKIILLRSDILIVRDYINKIFQTLKHTEKGLDIYNKILRKWSNKKNNSNKIYTVNDIKHDNVIPFDKAVNDGSVKGSFLDIIL